MSTRSCLYVFGEKDSGPYAVRLYRHCDGYPSETLAEIAGALGAGDAGAIAKALCDGGSIRLDGPPGGPCEAEALSLDLLGRQGDLEWIYFVDQKSKSVSVYGGGPSLPAEHVNAGPRDPAWEIESLYPQYRAETLERILGAVEAVGAAGWSFNQSSLGIEAECAREALRESRYRELFGKIPDGHAIAYAWPDKKETFEGKAAYANEDYALLEHKPASGGRWWSAHEISAIDNPERLLKAGAPVRIRYDGSGRGSASIAQSRDFGAGPSQGM